VPKIVNKIPGFSPDPGHKTSQSSPVCPTADCVNMIDHVTTAEQDVVVQCCGDDNNSVNRTAVDYVNAIRETDDDCIIESVKHPLSYFDLDVALLSTPNVCVRVKALNDSDSECALICQSVLQRVEQSDPVVPIGEVKISGICGDSVVCPLVHLKVHPARVESGIIITAAVMNTLSDDLVLPSTIVKCLDEMSSNLSVNVTTRSHTHNEVENQQNGESNDDLQVFVDLGFSTEGQGLSENSLDSESCTQLISEQKPDPSLN